MPPGFRSERLQWDDQNMSMSKATVRWVAKCMRVDPLDAAIEADPPSDRRREVASELLDAGELLDLVADEIGPEEVLGYAIQRLPAEPERVASALNGEPISDAAISELVDRRELWPDPIERVAHLDDDPTSCYLWILSDDATEDDRISLAVEFEEEYIRENRNEPQALHLIVRDVEEIRELSAEEVRRHIKPWLKGAGEDDL